ADKLLARLPGGDTVLATSADRLLAAVDEVLAVVPGADHARARLLDELGLPWVVCPDAADGMAHSLRAGIAATADADAWLVALADMPFVAVDTLQRLVAALRAGASIALPSHAGRDGHPVGFAASQRDALLALGGDRGARALIERAGSAVRRIAVEDAGVLRDIDRPQDLPEGSEQG
ncbi:MAG: nucleotidyltransferase family protein, partial [Gammaproteobacteria bacterium]|nr:nucleotidyltransferase family protein [Gammaproteobacteria bacterium]